MLFLLIFFLGLLHDPIPSCHLIYFAVVSRYVYFHKLSGVIFVSIFETGKIHERFILTKRTTTTLGRPKDSRLFLFVCLFVCLFVFLFVYLFICLFASTLGMYDRVERNYYLCNYYYSIV